MSEAESPLAGIVQELERRFLPQLGAEAERLRREYPKHRFFVESNPVGRSTDLQGHAVYIDCLLPNADDANHSDQVTLEIGVQRISTEAMLDTADVYWGHTSGHLELDLLSAPVSASREQLDRIESQLPALVAALRRALLRGQAEHGSRSATVRP